MTARIAAWLVMAVVVLWLCPVSEARSTTTAREQVGVASWYGHRHEGHRMANGQPYRTLALTAASVTVPLGAWVSVTNLDNGRFVVLQITDRGPYLRRRRIIDVSLAAARRLDMVRRGLARVQVREL